MAAPSIVWRARAMEGAQPSSPFPTPPPTTAVCPRCGARSTGGTFCPTCGYRLGGSPTRPLPFSAGELGLLLLLVIAIAGFVTIVVRPDLVGLQPAAAVPASATPAAPEQVTPLEFASSVHDMFAQLGQHMDSANTFMQTGEWSTAAASIRDADSSATQLLGWLRAHPPQACYASVHALAVDAAAAYNDALPIYGDAVSKFASGDLVGAQAGIDRSRPLLDLANQASGRLANAVRGMPCV